MDRKDWIIATKFGHRFHRNFERTDHWSLQEVMEQLDKLRDLGISIGSNDNLYQTQRATAVGASLMIIRKRWRNRRPQASRSWNPSRA